MRRGLPAAGVVLVLGPLVLLVLLVAPGDAPTRPARPGDSGRGGAGAGVAAASAASLVTVAPVISAVARDLLERAATAPSRLTYHGVQFVSAWTTGITTSRVLDIAHRAGGRTTLRADGTAESPAAAVTMTSSGSPSVLSLGAVGLLTMHFSLDVVGTAQVAGRTADVVAAKRPGSAGAGQPDAARFWVDRDTGLMLRREVYDDRGRTTRAGAFISLVVRDPSDSSTDPTDNADVPTDGAASVEQPWTASYDTAALTRMRQQGWTCPLTLPGPLTLVDARRSAAGIVHLSYSDGLAVVSVFEQRGDLDERGLADHRRTTIAEHRVWEQDGVPMRMVWTSGSTVFTVVADAPQRTVDQVVAALPHAPAPGGSVGGAVARVGRGLDRVASWFDPFG